MSKPAPGDVSAKLAVPAKKSLFERQKAEAEAKRRKEQEETAAVYEDFVKSFDNEEDDVVGIFDSAAGGGSKRHFLSQGSSVRGGFGSRGRGSGPGSLGPAPGFSKKRHFDQAPLQRESRHGEYALGDFDQRNTRKPFQSHDEDDRQDTSRSRAVEKVAPKPTLQLSLLPPGTSVAVVKSLMPSNLNVDGVKFINSGSSDRRAATAIVTMSESTPAADLDAAVSALQSRYLGWGFYLSISRHLSSAVTNSSLQTGPSSLPLPFGAKPVNTALQYSLSRAPPPEQRGFAPPSFYGPGRPRNGGPNQVNVISPTDLKQLKLIHKTVESIMTHGPEFEALLMSRPEVQREEKWSWIWDPRSDGGVYYRWRLWDILTNTQERVRSGNGRNHGATQKLFDSGAAWSAPETKLFFEYTTRLEEVVSHSDYDSSEDEDSGDEGRKRLERLQGATIPESGVPGDNDLPAYLNPLNKAKLIHLLSRLPTTTARLRRGDVARVTSFAISHAGAGADEVVSLLTQNIHKPFSHLAVVSSKDEDDMETEPIDGREKEDPSSAKLIGLYLVSDILSSSSTSGVRHAWRYRALFEAALHGHMTFAHLGRLERDLAWGKLRAEKWKRSVMVLLSLWEGWCVFPAQAQEEFVKVFNDPPLTEEEKLVVKRDEKERIERERTKSKWKTMSTEKPTADTEEQKDVGVHMEEDLDGEPMADDDLDGEPMEEDDKIDGELMSEEEDQVAVVGTEAKSEAGEEPSATELLSNAAQQSRRNRPKAEDMFADYD